jgi:glycosyltransferase involved in cell wall biosynthesis
MNKIKLSVIIPVRNGEEYISESIDSLISQTYKGFEIIIINDGSTDSTLSILNSYQLSNLKIFSTSGVGLVQALNLGISKSNGEFIARLDADDICFPNRFEKQVLVLENNNKIGAVFTGFETINESGEILSQVNLVAKKREDILDSLIFKQKFIPLIHPSVMLRRSCLLEVSSYREYTSCEDRDLWIRLIKISDFYFIKEPLLKYRVNPKGISHLNREQQIFSGIMCAFNFEVKEKFDVDLYLDDKELFLFFEKYIVFLFEKNNKFLINLISSLFNDRISKKISHIIFYNNLKRRKIINLMIELFTEINNKNLI